MMKKKSDKMRIWKRCIGTGQDGLSQFDDRFEDPTIELNLPQRPKQDLWNVEAKYDTKYNA